MHTVVGFFNFFFLILGFDTDVLYEFAIILSNVKFLTERKFDFPFPCFLGQKRALNVLIEKFYHKIPYEVLKNMAMCVELDDLDSSFEKVDFSIKRTLSEKIKDMQRNTVASFPAVSVTVSKTESLNPKMENQKMISKSNSLRNLVSFVENPSSSQLKRSSLSYPSPQLRSSVAKYEQYPENILRSLLGFKEELITENVSTLKVSFLLKMLEKFIKVS
jgi:hypothetical protein